MSKKFCLHRVAVIFIIFVLVFIPGTTFAEEFHVKIGVLANRGHDRCLAKWSPTAEYLTKALPGKRFEIIPIDFHLVTRIVEKGEVDFILANPAFYVELEVKYGVNRIATLKNKRLNGTYKTFGGVIFCLKNRRDIQGLKDLKDKSFMAVEKKSLGGWYMAWRELKEAGINPFSDFSSLKFGGTHDEVVYAVQNSAVDAGTVRTDTLERMQLEGKIKFDDFHVIHEHGGGNVHLPLLHSTREYPEWPMAKVRHTPDSLAEMVAIKLVEMPEDSSAAVSASCSGWTIPMNYQGVHDCLKLLHVAPYDHQVEITLRDVFNKYWPVIVITLFLFLMMALSTGIFIRLNRNIRAASIDLKREIKGHKETMRLLQAAKAEAEKASMAKGKFLANMSHEIRTPMNAIIGMSHLCLGTELQPQQRSYIEMVYQSAHLLMGIINDVLDISKIESGKLKLESRSFRLDEVLNNLNSMISIKAQEKGLEILFDIAPETPFNLTGDPLRFGQILLNLAGNALKFTESGEIVVGIRPVKMDEKTVELEVMVKDTGIGMTREEQSKIFQSFSQADASTTRRFGGTGLGLTISKHLVQEMNGTIRVESEPDKGSSFYFTAVLGRDSGNGEKLQSKLPVDIKNLKVLVVDDVASVRDMFASILASFSFRVTCVDSGKAAIEAIKDAPEDEPFRLVLMDYMMPGIDGIEASKLIKKSTGLTDIPFIIMVTALGREEMMDRAREAGLEGFLTKPVTPSDIFNAIMSILGESEGIRKVEKSSDQWRIKTLENISGAHVLLAEDDRINQTLAKHILTKAGLQVTIADNGKQAVELAGKTNFDAILMDINMPEMDGYEATKAIRGKDSGKKLPIIAMTANAMAGDRERCIAAGMDDHVAKPIDPGHLFETLVKWIPEVFENMPVQPETAHEESQAERIMLPDHMDGIDMEIGLNRSAGNPILYIKLLKDFVNLHGNDNQIISDAIVNEDITLAHRTAHSLKGVAGGIGAQPLYDSAQQLETALQNGQYETVEPLIKNMAENLQEVVDDIRKKLMSPLSAETETIQPGKTTQPIDRETLIPLLNLFQELAREMDPDAEDTAEEINELLVLHGDISSPLSSRLVDQAANLDFEDALETLEEIRGAYCRDIDD